MTTVGLASERAIRDIPAEYELWPARTRRAIVAIGVQTDRSRLASLLRADGFEVAAVCDGFQLIDQIADAILGREGSRRPDLIISDAVLPGCTGLSLLAGVRDLGWSTPVILLTRPDHAEARWQAWNNRVTGLFIEPYDPRELRAFVRIVMDPMAGAAIRAARLPRS